MKLVICLDDNKGMLFNNRRQSRDKCVIEDIFKTFDMVYITPFSQKLFADYGEKAVVTQNIAEIPSEKALFIENIDPDTLGNISEITVYNWNRVYPADLYCSVDFGKFNLIEETKFSGNSHAEITKKVFVRGL